MMTYLYLDSELYLHISTFNQNVTEKRTIAVFSFYTLVRFCTRQYLYGLELVCRVSNKSVLLFIKLCRAEWYINDE